MDECPDNTGSGSCITLSELISTTSPRFAKISTIHFLPGIHTSSVSGWIHFVKHSTNITILGEISTCSPVCSVTVDCREVKIGFAFTSFLSVKIANIHISHCGFYCQDLLEFQGLYGSNYPDCRLDMRITASVLLANVVQIELSSLTINRSSGYGILIMPVSRVKHYDKQQFFKARNIILVQNSAVTESNWNFTSKERSIGGNITSCSKP